MTVLVAPGLLEGRTQEGATDDTFVHNDIISLTGRAPRFDLAESVGPDLRLGELSGPATADELRLGYATAAGDPDLRAAIAAQHLVEADDVVVTIGGMHALFLTGYILCGRGEEAIIATPSFPRHATR